MLDGQMLQYSLMTYKNIFLELKRKQQLVKWTLKIRLKDVLGEEIKQMTRIFLKEALKLSNTLVLQVSIHIYLQVDNNALLRDYLGNDYNTNNYLTNECLVKVTAKEREYDNHKLIKSSVQYRVIVRYLETPFYQTYSGKTQYCQLRLNRIINWNQSIA
ncbi:Hypothetical_protein [Hexamita inflata]|uniref:Hypothetical_protein n=1 Tax=Hexamita inflata TaxID=28002 RepID=A0AA86TH54_9EUKA|nr:Hypothetical protein HINF_LOCUS4726 [Hexamita inflata]